MGVLSIQADETALSLFRRCNTVPFSTGISFLDGAGIVAGDVVEVYGPSPSGKSELLLNVVLQTVLPKEMGGRASRAVCVDLDGNLSVLRIEQMLRERVGASACFRAGTMPIPDVALPAEVDPGSPEGRVTSVMLQCMQRIKFVSCQNHLQLIAAMEVLHYESAQEATLVVAIDSLGSLVGKSKLSDSALVLQNAALRATARLASERSVVVMAAKPALFANLGWGQGMGNRSGSKMEHWEYMPSAWQKVVSHRVMLQRVPDQGEGQGFTLFNACVVQPHEGRAAEALVMSADPTRWLVSDRGVHNA
ncbi:unnamed protein product [Chrysoparadoxa australica]